MMIFSALLAVALAGAPGKSEVRQSGKSAVSADENRMLSASIADLRRRLPDARAARFRRVHFFTAVGQDGIRRKMLCGQVWSDDPRAPAGWTMFGAANLRSGFMQVVGEMAVRWCAQPKPEEWDYTRDFAGRYSTEITGTP